MPELAGAVLFFNSIRLKKRCLLISSFYNLFCIYSFKGILIKPPFKSKENYWFHNNSFVRIITKNYDWSLCVKT